MSDHPLESGLIDPERFGTVDRVTDGVSMLHGFANVAFVFGRGVVLVADTSAEAMGPRAVDALRALTEEPIRALVYTHGHVDHTGGAPFFLADARKRGHADPQIWAHEGILERFERYLRTWAWNNEVNRRQFSMPKGAHVFPTSFVKPTHTYRDRATISLGTEAIELRHARGETDDATWIWLPTRRVAIVGDLLIHSMPNTGNPNKPQRYTLGWAEALEAIAAESPAHLVPGHGAPVSGPLAIEMLSETARALRFLHDAVLDRLNAGRWPDEIVSEGIRLPRDLEAKPYLQPVYGCAPFVVRDVLRAYAGWWDGRPAELLPAPRGLVAGDLLDLIGEDALVDRVRALLGTREPKRALHLAAVLHEARPDDVDAHRLFADVLRAVAAAEPSFIARNFYEAAARPRDLE
jgi:alkyl sulfatase BDS1-like metallo-beta-lactamase superfamily hydrolase